MRSVFRLLLTLVMDALLLVAALLLLRVVVEFFGQVSGQSWAVQIHRLSSLVVLPFPFRTTPSPYHGVFDVNASATLPVALVAEWVVGMVRRTA